MSKIVEWTLGDMNAGPAPGDSPRLIQDRELAVKSIRALQADLDSVDQECSDLDSLEAASKAFRAADRMNRFQVRSVFACLQMVRVDFGTGETKPENVGQLSEGELQIRQEFDQRLVDSTDELAQRLGARVAKLRSEAADKALGK